MGQVRHGSATTTHAVRAAIQRSQASVATLSRELGINPKTVAKWRKGATVEDLKTGWKAPHSTTLTEAEEAMVVAFRRHTLLPLDDCLYALQPSIPHLTRSALHRCLQRHGISRLPDVEGDKPRRQSFKRYPIGFFHMDIAEVQTAEGKLYLFVGIDRTSKFAVTQLVDKADRRTAWEFLEHLLKAVPYRIHTILTDNGIQFAEQPRNRNTAWSRQMRFDMICEAHYIEHRLTKPNHPWTNGQVERMNRTIKEATVKRFHYESHDQLRTHLADFMAAYNFARRLKTLSGLTPYEYITKIWTSEPDRFIVDPIHQMPGLGAINSFVALDVWQARDARPTEGTDAGLAWSDAGSTAAIHTGNRRAAAACAAGTSTIASLASIRVVEHGAFGAIFKFSTVGRLRHLAMPWDLSRAPRSAHRALPYGAARRSGRLRRERSSSNRPGRNRNRDRRPL